MNHHSRVWKPALATALLLSALGASAQGTAQGNDRERYLQERERCRTHNTQDSLATCLREAGAALHASRNGQLTSPGEQARHNATQRCSAFKAPEDQAECVRRVNNAPASGSVSGGGVLRESTTVVPQPQ